MEKKGECEEEEKRGENIDCYKLERTRGIGMMRCVIILERKKTDIPIVDKSTMEIKYIPRT